MDGVRSSPRSTISPSVTLRFSRIVVTTKEYIPTSRFNRLLVPKPQPKKPLSSPLTS